MASSFNGAAAKSSGKCPPPRLPSSLGPQRFNGAAAKSSGKYATPLDAPETRRASMGPPLKAAENRRGHPGAAHRGPGFNGAAAKSSGKSLVTLS